MYAIDIQHLQKNYGKNIGTRDVTLSVAPGEIFGFVGPNGAGKSTTIKVLLGFIRPTGGKAEIMGLDAVKQTKAIKAFTGYIPSDVRLYANMRVKSLLAHNAAFYPGDVSAEAARLCALFEVDTSKAFHALSLGNKKKVSIVCALMANPKIIILDEPTSGLDPLMQRRLFEELKLRTTSGATVFLSSHNLAEVQEYCDRVALIKGGVITSVMDVPKGIAPDKIVTITGGGAAPTAFECIREDGASRVFRTALTGRELLDVLRALNPEDFTVRNESLDERFHAFYEGGKVE